MRKFFCFVTFACTKARSRFPTQGVNFLGEWLEENPKM